MFSVTGNNDPLHETLRVQGILKAPHERKSEFLFRKIFPFISITVLSDFYNYKIITAFHNVQSEADNASVAIGITSPITVYCGFPDGHPRDFTSGTRWKPKLPKLPKPFHDQMAILLTIIS